MKNVLITNTESRKALALVREFGKLNCKVYGISTFKRTICSFSKFIEMDFFVEKIDTYEISSIIEKFDINIVIPCEEETMELIINSDIIGEEVEVIAPTMKSFNIARNKNETVDFAIRLSVPTPKTFLVSTKNEISELICKINFNKNTYFVKPIKGSGSRGTSINNSENELIKNIIDCLNNYGPLLVQEYVPPGGDAIGISYLYKNGQMIASFAHKRLREFPSTGGPSTLCVSIKDEVAFKYGKTLLDNLCWNGLAMVEFKINPITGQHMLMEINPRVWGSVELAIRSGVSFPKYILEPQTAFNGYEIGRKLRWFFPADILSIITSKSNIYRKISQLFFTSYRKTSYMIFSKKDVKPFLYYVFYILKNALNLKKIKAKVAKKERLS